MDSARNNLVEFAPKFAVDLIDLLDQTVIYFSSFATGTC